jgi:hypothetical protein
MNRQEYMDNLSMRIASVCNGASKFDAALACACVICFSLAEEPNRDDLMSQVYVFMEEILAMHDSKDHTHQ